MSSLGLDLLKKACNAISYLKFDDLEIGRQYSIERFELFSETKYGACIVVYINGDMLYLPKRFNKIFKTAEQIENLNKFKHVLIYNGKDETQGNRVLVDFELDLRPGADTVDGHTYWFIDFELDQRTGADTDDEMEINNVSKFNFYMIIMIFEMVKKKNLV